EAVNMFGAAAIPFTRIEHQVEIFHLRLALGQLAADHSDAAEAYDPVLSANSGGFDVAKKHGRRKLIAARNSAPPPPKPREAGAGLAGGRGKRMRSGVAQRMDPPFRTTPIAGQTKVPLLLGPSPGQRARQRGDREARRRRPVEDVRDDPR